MPDQVQYQARLKAYMEGRDPLAMQSETPRILAELIEDLPEATLRQRPAPGKWSIAEIIAHLAEDEIATSWRYRQMIENSGCTLPGFDQDEWARLGAYASWNSAEALQLFRLLREANLRMLGRLTGDEWNRCGLHEERGKITVRDLARHMAGHDVNHLNQVHAISNQLRG